ncbi:hypothetical protein CYMTET_51018 [Cymbomonas tetramitiformis]|uniref:ABM domain-containing protein n=1 Tax=Cymbomonas tetramitiformis TaxID=36881 RepID=A0AAE0BM44_9CHLO|nr:hypothetical protein CYMTET_51018 [Cymbomonas tetramitiformis]
MGCGNSKEASTAADVRSAAPASSQYPVPAQAPAEAPTAPQITPTPTTAPTSASAPASANTSAPAPTPAITPNAAAIAAAAVPVYDSSPEAKLPQPDCILLFHSCSDPLAHSFLFYVKTGRKEMLLSFVNRAHEDYLVRQKELPLVKPSARILEYETPALEYFETLTSPSKERGLRRNVIIFESSGGPDKGLDGFRKETLPLVDALRARGWNAEVMFYTAENTDTIFRRVRESADAIVHRIGQGTLANEEAYFTMLRDLIREGLMTFPHPDTIEKYRALNDAPAFPVRGGMPTGNCSVLMINRSPVGVKCGAAARWEPPLKYASFLREFCPAWDSLNKSLGCTEIPPLSAASFAVDDGVASLSELECTCVDFAADLEVAEMVAQEIICMVAEAKLLKKSVAILEMPGGSDKGPDGFRRDTLALCNAVTDLPGWRAEVIFYTDAHKEKIRQHVLDHADAFIHRASVENMVDQQGYLEMLEDLQAGGVIGLPGAACLTKFGGTDRHKIAGDVRVLMIGAHPYCMMTGEDPSRRIHPSKYPDLAALIRATAVQEHFVSAEASRPSVWTLDYQKTADSWSLCATDMCCVDFNFEMVAASVSLAIRQGIACVKGGLKLEPVNEWSKLIQSRMEWRCWPESEEEGAMRPPPEGAEGIGCTTEFGVYGAFASGDTARTVELVLRDAEVQVREEPRAPRFACMGAHTRTSEECSAPPDEMTRNKVFWLASFESQDAYDTDHKNRESNKAFVKELMGTGLNKDNPVMNFMGSYMGPMWYWEKLGAASGGMSTAYTMVVGVKCRDAVCAGELVEMNKAYAPKMLAAEEGALRFTMIRESEGVGPGPKDDSKVMWIEVWDSASAHEAHRKTAHFAEIKPKVEALLGDIKKDFWVMDFAETKHFAR